MMSEKSIGLLSTAQYLAQLKRVAKILEKQGYETKKGGQILGCDVSSATDIQEDVEAFLYVGSGRFHPISVAYVTGKPVYMANPYSDLADEIDEDEVMQVKRSRKARIVRAYEANVFGILVSTKTHQFSLEEAFQIKERIENAGRRAFIFAGAELTPDNVLPFAVDAWVNTACPRLVEDPFQMPVLNPHDLKIILGEE